VSEASFAARFRAALASADTVPGDRWVVAVSGGLDSVVLLHMLRFTAAPGASLVVAHFDHGMRPSSGDDAHWVAGLAASWGLPSRVGRAADRLTSEGGAREARYAFLEEVRRESGARLVLTAHHADDQAETVLFRALRGTGHAGLAGMAAYRDRLLRPLLSFWREELEAYGRTARLDWREDESNRSLRFARNALRHRVLPDIERMVAPGARRALVRLADLAREEEAGWESVVAALLESLELEQRDGRHSVDRRRLEALHPAVRARVLRTLAAKVGRSLDEATTRRAVEFVATAASGVVIDLGGAVTLRKDLDRIAVGAATTVPADRAVHIPDTRPGAGSALLAGRVISVSWGGDVAASGYEAASFDADELRFPLCVRARLPGDRIRLQGGTKKVKKLLLERRIPETERGCVPLLVDAAGDVLWIPGLARAAQCAADGSLSIGVGR
jgi:tRNA(Ile)-lysidine synthase